MHTKHKIVMWISNFLDEYLIEYRDGGVMQENDCKTFNFLPFLCIFTHYWMCAWILWLKWVILHRLKWKKGFFKVIMYMKLCYEFILSGWMNGCENLMEAKKGSKREI